MPGTRAFFVGSLLLSLLLALALFAGTLQTRDVSAEVAAGYDLWRANGCEGCHTLYGHGGPYAPDLTHIYSQRGDSYLREFLLNPNAFHPNQRVMPSFGLTVSETDNLLAFLDWVDEQDTGWPPRPIQVSSGVSEVASAAVPITSALPDDPVERGRYWFSRPPANCATCHALEPDVVIVGPSLAGVASRAGTRVPGQSAEQYIRNSLINPGDFVVPGFQNVMAQNLGTQLTAEQINDIIAFLMTLE
jgi:nitric oxide reductase subunit C